MKKLLLFLPSFLLLSCKLDLEATEVKPLIVQPKMVVVSFISPQSIKHVVSVTLSKPVFSAYDYNNSSRFTAVEKALVVISNGSNEAIFAYNYEEEIYELAADAYPIESGRTYFLTVTAPDGRKVKATCTVPAKTNTDIKLANFVSSEEKTGAGSSKTTYSVDVEWIDLPGTGDFYRVYAHVKLDREELNMARFIFNGDDLIQNFISDQDQDMGRFIVKNGILTSYNFGTLNDSLKEIYCTLLTTDRNYFLYHQYLYKTSYSSFGEPLLPFTNMEGGLGIFAAYNQYTKIFTIDK